MVVTNNNAIVALLFLYVDKRNDKPHQVNSTTIYILYYFSLIYDDGSGDKHNLIAPSDAT